MIVTSGLQAGVAEAMPRLPDQTNQSEAGSGPSLLMLPTGTYKLDEWITLVEHSRKYDVNKATISLRILRGIIPY
ncbi:hypothetical protein [Fibrella arboris]|uniref:hypothetical protein n=1 Tax=Fibrella arboris TaxID=3242486 RepID=UPI003521728D